MTPMFLSCRPVFGEEWSWLILKRAPFYDIENIPALYSAFSLEALHRRRSVMLRMLRTVLLLPVLQFPLQAAQGTGDGGPALSAQLYYPNSVKVDAAGNVYIAEQDLRIRRVTMSTGVIDTIALGTPGRLGPTGDGGPATAARFSNPKDIAVDAAGNLY